MRMPAPLKWLLLYAAVWTGAAAAAPQGDVPPSLMSAAECMARALRSMPGVTDVEITVAPATGRPYPVLAYRFADAAGRRRFTELSLFEIEGISDAPPPPPPPPSPPAPRICLPNVSRLLSMMIGLSLKRKFFTGCLIAPFSMQKVPSRVNPV